MQVVKLQPVICITKTPRLHISCLYNTMSYLMHLADFAWSVYNERSGSFFSSQVETHLFPVFVYTYACVF
jgi:hypothetical protein